MSMKYYCLKRRHLILVVDLLRWLEIRQLALEQWFEKRGSSVYWLDCPFLVPIYMYIYTYGHAKANKNLPALSQDWRLQARI